MRARLIRGLLVVAAVAIVPAAAQAGTRADYRQTFTTAVPGASTGTDTQILYKNPSDPSAKPIPVREEVFTFPAGTSFDNSVVPDCTVSDLELELLGKSACPPESWIGRGEGDTSMTGFPGAGETQLDVDGFDADSGARLLGGAKPFGPRFATRAVRRGRVITVAVPRTPGGPPDGESALRWVHNVFAPRSVGGRDYTRTPRLCPPSGVWTFTARFTFADGVVEHDAYDMPCQR
jgi:hypothetical protein